MLDTTSIIEQMIFAVYMITCVDTPIRELYIQIYLYFLSYFQEYVFLCAYKYIVCTYMCAYLLVYIYICTQTFSQHHLANLFSYSNRFNVDFSHLFLLTA